MNKKGLLSLCRLYKGEASINDNPLKKDDDEFKWYMWRVEYAALHDVLSAKNADEAEEYVKNYIHDKIAEFASEPFGGDAQPYYERYFNY